MKEVTYLSLIGLLVGCGQSAESPNALFDSGSDAAPVSVDGPSTPQSWTGYIENCKLQWDGSDAIHLEFGTDTAGHVVGKVKFGNPSLQLPPATDPNIGYPPGYKSNTVEDWYEGFDFSLRDGKLSQTRLQFSADPYELWAGWCSLQVPYPGSSMCVPNWGASMSADFTSCSQTNPTTGETVAVDCGKLDLCFAGNAVCDCSGGVCKTATDHGAIMVDIAFSGDSANGSLVGIAANSCGYGNLNIRLTKDP